jgi:hypothetical protein
MSFSLEERCNNTLNPPCQKMVLAQGLINKESYAQFKEFTKDLSAGTWVVLTSPGGNLMNGMQMGAHIREKRFNTTIGNTDHSPADCLSACAYAFLGGLTRSLPANSRLGLHQFRGLDNAISTEDTQKLSTILAKYIDAMGIDRRILDIAQMTSANQVSVLTPEQIKQFKIDNLGQSPYPRWRLETTPQGQILMLSTFATNQPNLSGAIAFMRSKDNLHGIVYYKTNNATWFNAGTRIELQVAQQRFALAPVSAWENKPDGMQATFLITPALLQTLLQLPEEASVGILAQVIPPGGTPNNAGALAIQGYFGVGGFRNAAQAILNRN